MVLDFLNPTHKGGISWNQREKIVVDNSVKSIQSEAFYKCDRLKSIVIPEGVVSIGDFAFFGCVKLTSIDLPSTVKQIGKYAFCGCEELRSISILGAETIGDCAFWGCKKSTTIFLPSTLKQIGENTFYGCEELLSIDIPKGVREIGKAAFARCGHGNLQVELPSSLKVFNLLGLPEHLGSLVEVPEGIQIIGAKGFANSNLKSVKLPSTLTEIGNGAFQFCTELESIQVPEGVESIGSEAFQSCKKLRQVKLPSSLKIINASAFEDCKVLESINIPKGVERLDATFFHNCESLKTVFIEANLTELGGAFLGCQAISRVHFSKIHKAKKEPIESNTILHQMLLSKYPLPFIKEFLTACPNAVYERNMIGQTPLHFCIIFELDIEITKAIYEMGHKAVNMTNEFRKTPLDYWKEYGSDRQVGIILAAKSHRKAQVPTLALVRKGNQWKSYKKPNLLRWQHLILEVPAVARGDIALKETLRGQLQTRQLLFGKLLDEFSRLIKCDAKDAIQRAAAIQALTNVKNPINFGDFSSTGVWYQQEILKLILRVYHEDQNFPGERYRSSALADAMKGKEDLEKDEPPSVNNYRKSVFSSLVNWIVEDLEELDTPEGKLAADEEGRREKLEEKCYDLKGPTMKSLQSLFNKVYIRRGQTRVNIVGDMARGALVFKDTKHFDSVISRIKSKFPDIIDFEPVDNQAVKFLDQISEMKTIPIEAPFRENCGGYYSDRTIGSEIIPYRLKVNSSQENNTKPLLYNLNFFDLVPEYHWAGNSAMFVAFELQIGLESVVSNNFDGHGTYDETRILDAQPLLCIYIGRKTDACIASSVSTHSCEGDNDDNLKNLSVILEGNFSDCELKTLREIKLKGTGRNLTDLRTLFGTYRKLTGDWLDILFDVLIGFAKLFLQLKQRHEVWSYFVDKATTRIGRMKTRYMALGSLNVMAKGKDKIFRPPDRLCLNFKEFNRWAKEGKAFILDEVPLDSSVHYCIKAVQIELSMACTFPKKKPEDRNFKGMFCGIFASFGPYMVYFASKELLREGTIFLIDQQMNFEMLEKVCRLPSKCEKLYLIAWKDHVDTHYNFESLRDSYMDMRLVLKRYKEIKV